MFEKMVAQAAGLSNLASSMGTLNSYDIMAGVSLIDYDDAISIPR